MLHDASFELRTERLRLRRPTARDEKTAIDFFMSERAQYAGGQLSLIDAARSFAAHLGHWEIKGFGLWAVTLLDDDTILGLVGPYFPTGWPEPEICWLIFDGAEGKGYAQEAARAALRDAQERLGLTPIVHYIAPKNLRSIRLAERIGAVLDENAADPFPGKLCLVYRQPQ